MAIDFSFHNLLLPNYLSHAVSTSRPEPVKKESRKEYADFGFKMPEPKKYKAIHHRTFFEIVIFLGNHAVSLFLKL